MTEWLLQRGEMARVESDEPGGLRPPTRVKTQETGVSEMVPNPEPGQDRPAALEAS